MTIAIDGENEMDFVDAIDLSLDTPEKAQEFYSRVLEDRFYSQWGFLKNASLACLNSALAGFCSMINSWQENQESGSQDRAETKFLLGINYAFYVSGPMLAATIFPVFALESFMRSCAEVVLTRCTVGQQTWRLALDGFDRNSFEERLNIVLALTDSEKCPKDLIQSIKNLVSFRNDVVHDIPLWNAPFGALVRIKRGKIPPIENSKQYGGMFPDLQGHRIPITPGHAKKAIEIHDGVVHHIFKNEEFLKAFDKVTLDPSAKLMKDSASDIWNQIDKIDRLWKEEVLPWFDSIPLEEEQKMMRFFRRKSKIKRVK